MSVHHCGCWNTYAVTTEEWDQLTYKFARLSLKEQSELDQVTHNFFLTMSQREWKRDYSKERHSVFLTLQTCTKHKGNPYLSV